MGIRLWPQPPTGDSKESFSMKRWFEQVAAYFRDVLYIGKDGKVGISSDATISDASPPQAELEIRSTNSVTTPRTKIRLKGGNSSSNYFLDINEHFYDVAGGHMEWYINVNDVGTGSTKDIMYLYGDGTARFPYALQCGVSNTSINSLTVYGTNVGANIQMINLSASTSPYKYLRCYGDPSSFQIINSAYSAALFSVDDSGNVSNSGTIAPAQGLYMPPYANSNVNTLDAYEEGTWTPKISAGTFAATYAIQSGTYTRIGRMVYYTGTILISSITAIGSGGVNIAGLPYTSSASADFVAGSIQSSGATSPDVGYIQGGTSYIQLYYRTSSSGPNSNSYNVGSLANGQYLRFSGCYHV